MKKTSNYYFLEELHMEIPPISRFCWNELATNDVSKAKKFYSEVLGWEFREIKSDDMTYTIIRSKDKEFGGMWQISQENEEDVPPHWMAYILVTNIKDILEKAKTRGATEIKGVTHVGDMGSFAVITDPTGAHIAFWEANNR
jgi:predicted enzyme related to lactoylglutathione lyase